MSINLYPLTHRAGSDDFSIGARAAAEFIGNQAVTAEKGIYWQAQADRDQKLPVNLDLYNGSAGIVLFYLQLAKVLGDDAYRNAAIAGGEYIVNEFEKTQYRYQMPAGIFNGPYGNSWGLYYGGLAGIAFSLLELGKAFQSPALGNGAFRTAALKITERIAREATRLDIGVIWSGYSNITQDGGTILYLLRAAEEFNRPEWKDLAIQGAKAIAATEVTVNERYIRFAGDKKLLESLAKFPALASSLNIGADSFFPDFGYGTAGLSYVLAKIAGLTGDAELLEKAEKSADYVASLATNTGNGRLVPYLYPDTTGSLHYLGFCHGPVGTARTYVLLYQLTKKEKYRDFYLGLVEGLIEAGAPEHHSAGFWHNHCACCGTAGFINLFLGVWGETGDRKYLEYADRSAQVIIGNATYNGKEAVWYQAFSRIDPNLITADIGLYNGAAGIALSLVQTASALQGKFDPLRLPDEPYTK